MPKVEWHPEELYPRVGFIITSLSRLANRVVAFYIQRGTAEQHIKEGKNAINWTRLSCRKFRYNAVQLQLHTAARDLANVMRTLAWSKEVEHWSLTTLREILVKIGAKVVSHDRYVEVVPWAVGLWYDSPEFGRHLGNIGLIRICSPTSTAALSS